MASERSASEAEFRELTDRHRRELTVHCYRMLGSVADAEDMMQETLLRAWQGLAGFEGRASHRTWLYRIATNVCLDALARRRARTLPTSAGTAADPESALPPPMMEPVWIEPLPDSLLAGVEMGPEARFTERESVALAFVTALQALPALQRAVVVLRDVLGFSANETAEILQTTTAAANSALQRARETLDEGAAPATADDDVVRELCARFVRAWEAGDATGIVALLRDDAVFSMPPFPLWYQGRDAIMTFLAAVVFAGRSYRARIVAANGQPALAIYERSEDGSYVPGALYVLTVDGAAIAQMHAFLAMGEPSFFTRFEDEPSPARV